MVSPSRRLGELLVERKVLSRDDLEEMLDREEREGTPLPRLLAKQEWAQRLHRMDTGIPYGIALAIGALIVYPDTEWIKAIDVAHFAFG